MVKARLADLGGAGPPILLIHGYGSDSLSWSALMPHLASFCHVHAIDLPGHGKAPADVGDGTLDTLTKAVELAVTDLPQPFALLGHSLGGAVAIALQKRMPASVTSLTLIAPAGFGKIKDPDFPDDFANAETEEELRPVLLRLVTREKLIQPMLARHVLTGLAGAGRREALRQLAVTLKTMDRLDLPYPARTRLIWGEDDRIMRYPHRVEAMGLAGIYRFPDCGHLPHVEAAAQTAKAIRAS